LSDTIDSGFNSGLSYYGIAELWRGTVSRAYWCVYCASKCTITCILIAAVL